MCKVCEEVNIVWMDDVYVCGILGGVCNTCMWCVMWESVFVYVWCMHVKWEVCLNGIRYGVYMVCVEVYVGHKYICDLGRKCAGMWGMYVCQVSTPTLARPFMCC